MEYSSKSFDGLRKHTITQYTLISEGVTGQRFKSEEMLTSMSTMYDRAWSKSPTFYYGLLMLIAGMWGSSRFGAFSIYCEWTYEDISSLIFTVIAAVGGLVCLVGLRRVEYVQFKSDAGVPLVIIYKTGKRKNEFEGFVSELQKRILAAKQTQPQKTEHTAVVEVHDDEVLAHSKG